MHAHIVDHGADSADYIGQVIWRAPDVIYDEVAIPATPMMFDQ
jgi:hypothetical protein